MELWVIGLSDLQSLKVLKEIWQGTASQGLGWFWNILWIGNRVLEIETVPVGPRIQIETISVGFKVQHCDIDWDQEVVGNPHSGPTR
jgi:hypothetical protein